MVGKEYVVVSRNGTTSLTKAVELLIVEGWSPIGGIAISKDTNGRKVTTVYHQAMTK